MKKLIPACIIILIIFSACSKDKDKSTSNSCIPSKLNGNVLAFYSFGNGSINDFSGKAHHLSNFNNVSSAMDRSGNPNCATHFNGNQYLTIGNSTFLDNTNQFSVSLWYQPEDSTNPSAYQSLVCRDSNLRCPDKMGQWSVGLYDCKRAVFGLYNSVWDSLISTFPFTCQQEVAARINGGWHHLVATADSFNNEIKIYRDGVLQEVAQFHGHCSVPIKVQPVGNLFLGLRYIGFLDDVIIYNKTLSQSEVIGLYKMNACCSN